MHQDNRIRNPHLKTQKITTWSTWVLLGEHYNFDPYKNVDHSIDEGGGNSRNWEYVGDIPEKDPDKVPLEGFAEEGATDEEKAKEKERRIE